MVAFKKLRKFPIKAQQNKKTEFHFDTDGGPTTNSQWNIAASVDENAPANNSSRHEELNPPAMMTNKLIKAKRAGGVKAANLVEQEQDHVEEDETARAKAKIEPKANFVDGAAADRRNANVNVDEFIVYPYANKANLTKFDVYGYKQGDGGRSESEVEADAEAHRMAFSNGFREYLSANNLLTTTETNETNDNDISNDDADADDDNESASDDDNEDDGVIDDNEQDENVDAEDHRLVGGALIEESLRGAVMLTATATVTASTIGPTLLLSATSNATTTTAAATTSTSAMAAVAAAAAATATATAMPYLDNNLLGGVSVMGVASSVTPSPSSGSNQESPMSPHNQTAAGHFGDGVSIGAASTYWNLTATDDSDVDFFYRHSLTMSVVYCVAYVIVFLVGLIGNSFVISVVLRAPRMRTVTNYFIMNLAIADILVIVFCLPATLMSNIFVPWMLGWLMCKTVPYIQGVSVAASVYSLIAVSLDRFIAIWWPLKQMTKSRARFMILCIWVIALGSTIPWLLFFDLVPVQIDDSYPQAPEMYLCQEVWPPGTNGNLYFLLAHLVACYLLPMSLITLCYVLIWIKVSTRSIPGDSKDAQMDRMQQKSKVKVIKMLVAVVILFVLSWLPLYVIFARIKFGGEISIEESEILDKVTPFAQWLGSSNSCINPILYAFFNKKYRRGFAAIIQSRSCCGRLRYYDNVAIASSTTSTRKSSHYHNSSRKSPSSPGLRKTNAVSYIYEHNSLRRTHHHHHHSLMLKQDSNVSQQMLLKQDSHGSRQFLIKQESASSDGSRRLLCQQDSNGSKQDSVVSYMDTSRQRGTIMEANKDMNVEPNATTKSMLEYKRQKFVKQDSVISFVDQRPEPRRHQLVKQDSVISFADQRGKLTKQDSMIGHNAGGHHVSILKKTDSQHSNNGFPSPRRNVEIYE